MPKRPRQSLLEDYFPAQKRARYDGPPLLLELLSPALLRVLQGLILSRDRARLRCVCKLFLGLDPDFRGPAWMPDLSYRGPVRVVPTNWFPPDLHFRARTINFIERLGLLQLLAAYDPVVSWCHTHCQGYGIQIQWHFDKPQAVGLTKWQLLAVPFFNLYARYETILRKEYTLRHRFRGTWGGESYWELVTRDYHTTYGYGPPLVRKVRYLGDGFPYVDQMDPETEELLPDDGTDDNLHDLLARLGRHGVPLEWRQWTWRQYPGDDPSLLDAAIAQARENPTLADPPNYYSYF
jgi:hypothetical protein